MKKKTIIFLVGIIVASIIIGPQAMGRINRTLRNANDLMYNIDRLEQRLK